MANESVEVKSESLNQHALVSIATQQNQCAWYCMADYFAVEFLTGRLPENADSLKLLLSYMRKAYDLDMNFNATSLRELLSTKNPHQQQNILGLALRKSLSRNELHTEGEAPEVFLKLFSERFKIITQLVFANKVIDVNPNGDPSLPHLIVHYSGKSRLGHYNRMVDKPDDSMIALVNSRNASFDKEDDIYTDQCLNDIAPKIFDVFVVKNNENKSLIYNSDLITAVRNEVIQRQNEKGLLFAREHKEDKGLSPEASIQRLNNFTQYKTAFFEFNHNFCGYQEKDLTKEQQKLPEVQRQLLLNQLNDDYKLAKSEQQHIFESEDRSSQLRPTK